MQVHVEDAEQQSPFSAWSLFIKWSMGQGLHTTLHRVNAHGMQVHVEDAELLTDWQRRQAEFKQRRAISGAEGAKAKQERMRQFQQRLRGAAAAQQPAPAPTTEPTAEVRQAVLSFFSANASTSRPRGCTAAQPLYSVR